MIRKVLLAVATIGLISLSGCNIYFGPDSGCEFGDCVVAEPVPPDPDVIQPGGECATDANCAPGCFCSISDDTGEGVCVETGFCDSALDCADGFTCDGRATCIPAQAPTCGSPDECAQGSDCVIGDDGIGECVVTGNCSADDDCFGGTICDEDRATCVFEDPTPECSDYATEEACLADATCAASYRGLDCSSPDGSSCTAGESNCTCKVFIFDECALRE